MKMLCLCNIREGIFNDWRVLDRYKESLFGKADFWLDTHIANEPRMIDRETFLKGIEETVKTPFPCGSFL